MGLAGIAANTARSIEQNISIVSTTRRPNLHILKFAEQKKTINLPFLTNESIRQNNKRTIEHVQMHTRKHGASSR